VYSRRILLTSCSITSTGRCCSPCAANRHGFSPLLNSGAVRSIVYDALSSARVPAARGCPWTWAGAPAAPGHVRALHAYTFTSLWTCHAAPQQQPGVWHAFLTCLPPPPHLTASASTGAYFAAIAPSRTPAPSPSPRVRRALRGRQRWRARLRAARWRQTGRTLSPSCPRRRHHFADDAFTTCLLSRLLWTADGDTEIHVTRPLPSLTHCTPFPACTQTTHCAHTTHTYAPPFLPTSFGAFPSTHFTIPYLLCFHRVHFLNALPHWETCTPHLPPFLHHCLPSKHASSTPRYLWQAHARAGRQTRRSCRLLLKQASTSGGNIHPTACSCSAPHAGCMTLAHPARHSDFLPHSCETLHGGALAFGNRSVPAQRRAWHRGTLAHFLLGSPLVLRVTGGVACRERGARLATSVIPVPRHLHLRLTPDARRDMEFAVPSFS